MSDLLPEVICEPEPELAPAEEDLELPQIKEVIEDEFIFKDAPKKQRSQKQMEHLKNAREKALATRRANKVRREKAEAEARGEEYVEKPSKPERVASFTEPLKKYNLSEEELIDLQEKAVEKYDTKRKQRKVDKKKKALEETHSAKTYESVARAIHQPNNPDPEDVWALCFN